MSIPDFNFTPTEGWNNATEFPDYPARDQVRPLMQRLFDQIRDWINARQADKIKYAVFKRTANQSIPNGIDTQIQWQAKDVFNGEDFCEIDGATSRIKILKTGIYELDIVTTFAGNATGVRSYWGVVLNNLYPTTATSAYMTTREFIYATAGQILNTRVTQTSGGALDLIASVTFCRIRKVI